MRLRVPLWILVVAVAAAVAVHAGALSAYARLADVRVRVPGRRPEPAVGSSQPRSAEAAPRVRTTPVWPDETRPQAFWVEELEAPSPLPPLREPDAKAALGPPPPGSMVQAPRWHEEPTPPFARTLLAARRRGIDMAFVVPEASDAGARAARAAKLVRALLPRAAIRFHRYSPRDKGADPALARALDAATARAWRHGHGALVVLLPRPPAVRDISRLIAAADALHDKSGARVYVYLPAGAEGRPAFESLRRAGLRVGALDSKAEPGVDVLADTLGAAFRARLRKARERLAEGGR